MRSALHRLVFGFACIALGCDEPDVLDDLALPSAAARWEAIEARTADQGPGFEHGLAKMSSLDPNADNRRRAWSLWLEQPVPEIGPGHLTWITDDPSYAVRVLMLDAHYRLNGAAGVRELMGWLMICSRNHAWSRATLCIEQVEALASRPREVLALVTRDDLPFELDDQAMRGVLVVLDAIMLREPSLIDDPALVAWLDDHAAQIEGSCSGSPIASMRARWNYRGLAPWRRQ